MSSKKFKKKIVEPKPSIATNDVVRECNCLHIAFVVRQLHAYGWRKKRINDFLGGYMSLLDEVVDHRLSVNGAIKDAEDVTGIDIRKLVDELMNEEHKENRK